MSTSFVKYLERSWFAPNEKRNLDSCPGRYDQGEVKFTPYAPLARKYSYIIGLLRFFQISMAIGEVRLRHTNFFPLIRVNVQGRCFIVFTLSKVCFGKRKPCCLFRASCFELLYRKRFDNTEARSPVKNVRSMFLLSSLRG